MRIAAFLLLTLLIVGSLEPAEKPSVLLITIDTLRSDHVGCYGYFHAQTPNIDRLAAQGITFTQAISQVPLTRPSHTSIFTGLYPYEHGVHDNVAPSLNPKIPTLAEILHRQGYKTAAFVSSFVVNSQSGLDRGFDTYEDQFDPEKQPTQFALNLEKRGMEVYEEFANWIKKNNKQPYFAWVHLYDPHFPYEPPQPFLKRFADHPYDGEVAYSDMVVGKILSLVDPKTLVILTSDHGEGLGDHGESAHSFFIYDETLRVPLIFRWNGSLSSARKIPAQVRLVDLMPTILDLLSVQARIHTTGKSLKPLLLNPNQPDPGLTSYCESFTPWLHFGWSRLQGIRDKNWKYIQAPKAELYNLGTDPAELNNVLKIEPEKARQMKDWLEKSGALIEHRPDQSNAPLDSEQLEKLTSLGYTAGGSIPIASGSALADPKDKLQLFQQFNVLIHDGIEDFQAARYAQAVAKFEELRNKNVPSFEVHYFLGRSHLRLKSYDKASKELSQAIATLPHFLPAYRDLSEAEEGQGRLDQAERVLLAGLKIGPNDPNLVQSLAWFYQRQKRYGPAEKLLVGKLESHPDDLQSRFRLAAIYRDTGRAPEAIKQLSEIIKRKPDLAEAHNQLGMVLGGENQMQQALSEFTEAARLDPKSEIYRRNMQLAKTKSIGVPSNAGDFRFRIIETPSRAAAEVLLKKLSAGQTWDSLAHDYSIHPTAHSQQPVIEMAPADMEPLFARTLAKMQRGEISGILQTSRGFAILRKEN